MDYVYFGKKVVLVRIVRLWIKLWFGWEDVLDDKINYGFSFKWFYEFVVYLKSLWIKNEIFLLI